MNRRSILWGLLGLPLAPAAAKAAAKASYAHGGVVLGQAPAMMGEMPGEYLVSPTIWGEMTTPFFFEDGLLRARGIKVFDPRLTPSPAGEDSQ